MDSTLGCGCAVCTSATRATVAQASVLLRWREPGWGRRERVVVIDTGRISANKHCATASLAWTRFFTRTRTLTTFWAWMTCARSALRSRAKAAHSALCLAANGQVLERIYDYTFSEQSTYPPCARSLQPLVSAPRFTRRAAARALLHGRWRLPVFALAAPPI